MVSSSHEIQTDSVDNYYLNEAVDGSAPEGRFLIKLKIPNSEESKAEEDDATSSLTRKEKYYCADCDKSFSSGKALGGHMSSAHVQAGKNYQSKKPKTKNMYLDEIELQDGTKKYPCKICTRDFRSQKSLYGHMRCHPNREYRGMHPPEVMTSSPSDRVDGFSLEEVKEGSPFLVSNSCFESDDDESLNQSHDDGPFYPEMESSVDLISSLPAGWTVTGQRGRPMSDARLVGSISREEAEELSEAALSLVSLGNGVYPAGYKKEDNDQNLPRQLYDDDDDEDEDDEDDVRSMKEEEDVYPAKTTDSHIKLREPSKAYSYENAKRHLKSKKPRIQGRISPVKKQTAGEGSASYKGKAPIAASVHESSDQSDCEENLGMESVGVNKCTADDSDSEKTLEQQNHTNCIVPYKRRREKEKEKDEGKGKAFDTEPEINLSPTGERKDAATPGKYKCSTCNKSYSTYQALGGHRSSHNKLRVSIQNTTSEFSPENQSNTISQSLEAKEGSSTLGFELADPNYRCQICNKNFFSGQALGGHMRSHMITAPSSSAASPEENIQSQQKLLDFDLNELPDMEGNVEDEDGGS